MAAKLGSTKQQADDQQEFDPKYEWQENAANFLLKLHLSGFRKEDFRVQVDGAGRLTVRGQRADGTSRHVRFHKVFQLPPTSNLEDISGRFDSGVLTLTVPKRPAPSPPTTIDDIIGKGKPTAKKEDNEAKKTEPPPPPPPQQKEEINKPKQDAQKKAEDAEKKAENAEKKTEAKRSTAEQEQKKEPPPAVRKEEAKAPKAPETKPPQPQAADKVVDRESILEQRKAKAAAEEAERERKKPVSTGGGGWKDRMAEELQGLTRSEWAEGVVETVKKNKEVIAAAVAAFSLGVFVTSKLRSRS